MKKVLKFAFIGLAALALVGDLGGLVWFGIYREKITSLKSDPETVAHYDLYSQLCDESYNERDWNNSDTYCSQALNDALRLGRMKDYNKYMIQKRLSAIISKGIK